jgi:hypothetical protein
MIKNKMRDSKNELMDHIVHLNLCAELNVNMFDRKLKTFIRETKRKSVKKNLLILQGSANPVFSCKKTYENLTKKEN